MKMIVIQNSKFWNAADRKLNTKRKNSEIYKKL